MGEVRVQSVTTVGAVASKFDERCEISARARACSGNEVDKWMRVCVSAGAVAGLLAGWQKRRST